jgi:hypothetical protein
MNPTQNTPPARLRVDYSTADTYLRPQPPKLTFFQKLGRGLLGGLSFLTKIGGPVASLALPGIGLPIAAGAYGISRLSDDLLAKARLKDQIAMASQPQPTSMQFPGLFDTSPLKAGDAATDFIAPKSLEPQIGNVLINRNRAQEDQMNRFKL